MPRTYATWNPADKNAGMTLSGGNLTASGGGSGLSGVRSTISKSSGKWYWEVKCTADSALDSLGISNSSNTTYFPGYDGNSKGWYQNYASGLINAGQVFPPTGTWVVNDVIRFGLDAATGDLTIYKNSTSMGVMTDAVSGPYFAALGGNSNYGTFVANFGATAFDYTPFSGFNSGLYNSTPTLTTLTAVSSHNTVRKNTAKKIAKATETAVLFRKNLVKKIAKATETAVLFRKNLVKKIAKATETTVLIRKNLVGKSAKATATAVRFLTALMKHLKTMTATDTSVANRVNQVKATKKASATESAVRVNQVKATKKAVNAAAARYTKLFNHLRTLTATAIAVGKKVTSKLTTKRAFASEVPFFMRAFTVSHGSTSAGIGQASRKVSFQRIAVGTGAAFVVARRVILTTLTSVGTTVAKRVLSVNLIRTAVSSCSSLFKRSLTLVRTVHGSVVGILGPRTVSMQRRATAAYAATIGKLYVKRLTLTAVNISAASFVRFIGAFKRATSATQGHVKRRLSVVRATVVSSTTSLIRRVQGTFVAVASHTVNYVNKAGVALAATGVTVALRRYNLFLRKRATTVSLPRTSRFLHFVRTVVAGHSTSILNMAGVAMRATVTALGAFKSQTKKVLLGAAVVLVTRTRLAKLQILTTVSGATKYLRHTSLSRRSQSSGHAFKYKLIPRSLVALCTAFVKRSKDVSKIPFVSSVAFASYTDVQGRILTATSRLVFWLRAFASGFGLPSARRTITLKKKIRSFTLKVRK